MIPSAFDTENAEQRFQKELALARHSRFVLFTFECVLLVPQDTSRHNPDITRRSKACSNDVDMTLDPNISRILAGQGL